VCESGLHVANLFGMLPSTRDALCVRVYECPCGLVLERDHNASANILEKALNELQACGRAD
jgi:transposase